MPWLRFSFVTSGCLFDTDSAFFYAADGIPSDGAASSSGGGVSVRRVISTARRGRCVSACLNLAARLAAGALVAIGLAGSPALARSHPGRAEATYSGPTWEAILVDPETGQVLRELNADVPTYPASLTKMMTLYLTFEALNQGRIRLDTPFTVSAEAASRSPSKLGLAPGEAVPLRDLVFGLITRSANDAASVIAENLAGSQSNFAR